MNRGTLKIETSHTQGVQVSLILSDDGTVWMSVEEIAHTFNILATSVVRQIKKILAAGELYEKEVRREQTTTLPDGRLCIAEYYNLDMIIALCFSIRSYPCVVFRRWIPAADCPDAKIKTDYTSYSTNSSRRYNQLNAATAGENQNLPLFFCPYMTIWG